MSLWDISWVEYSGVSETLLWNGGEAAAAARVRGDCAVEALLRIEPTRNPALR